MPYVTTDDGAQIFYKDWGLDGDPVLLSHGWPLNSDAWEAAAMFLADNGYRVIAHDRRGHGRSTQTWEGNNMATYADDLACLIEPGPHQPHACRPFHGRRRSRPLCRTPRKRPGRSGRPGLRCTAHDAPHRRQPRRRAHRRLRRHPRRRSGQPLAVCIATSPTDRSSATTAPAASLRAPGTRSGCRAWRQAPETRTSASPPSSATDFRPDLAQARRSDPCHPRRRRPDRSLRGQRQTLRRTRRGRAAHRLRGRSPRPSRHSPRSAPLRHPSLHPLLKPESEPPDD